MYGSQPEDAPRNERKADVTSKNQALKDSVPRCAKIGKDIRTEACRKRTFQSPGRCANHVPPSRVWRGRVPAEPR